MSTEAEQASFEAQLSHLERLNNSRYRTSDFDFKIYKSLVDEIVQNLAKYCVYVNESTAIKDIERLTALRFFVPRKAVFSGSSFAGQTCIDPIIDAKIGHLRNSKASMKDLDPVNSLQRLGIIKTCLANAPSGYHTFGAELTVIIQQRSLDLGERIASSKVTTKSLSDVKVDSTIEGLLTRNTEIASQTAYGSKFRIAILLVLLHKERREREKYAKKAMDLKNENEMLKTELAKDLEVLRNDYQDLSTRYLKKLADLESKIEALQA